MKGTFIVPFFDCRVNSSENHIIQRVIILLVMLPTFRNNLIEKPIFSCTKKPLPYNNIGYFKQLAVNQKKLT
jgi:hypothetical protein